MTITKPGVYEVEESVYHADPAPEPSASSSLLKEIHQTSPLHGWMKHPRLNPDYVAKSNAAFDLGKAAHSLLLGAGAELVVVGEKDWRKNSAKDARAEAEAAGKVALLTHQMDAVSSMVAAARHQLKHHEDGALLLGPGHSEQSIFWIENGVWCRARHDRITRKRSIIFDYKTTTTAHPDTFARQILNLGYDIQAAHYVAGERALHGHEPKFVFVVQEVEPPYAVCVQTLTAPFMAIGEMKRQRALQQFKWCLEHNKWPGYPARTAWIEPPGYEKHKWFDENNKPLDSIKEETKTLFEVWAAAQAPLDTGDAA